MGIYHPGTGTLVFPENTGEFVPKGARFYFQMHYSPTGRRELDDRTKAGIYLYKTKPKYVLSSTGIYNRLFKIPAGSKDYHVSASFTFDQDVVLTGLRPHMHTRGKSMKFMIIYPDGKEETALSVPNYRYKWQRIYYLVEPKKLPAGTTIDIEATYDNSTQNPDNPDPTKDVFFGAERKNEMCLGQIFYYWPNKDTEH